MRLVRVTLRRCLISHRDLAWGHGRIEVANLIFVVDLDRLAEGSDFDDGHPISYEADKANSLWHMAVDPLFIASTFCVATRLITNLILRSAQRSQHHSMVHADKNFVGGDGVLQQWRKRIRVGQL